MEPGGSIPHSQGLSNNYKEPTILKIGLVTAIKDKQRKKATGDYNISVDLLKKLGESGLEIMTVITRST